jgi:hypothetical protein
MTGRNIIAAIAAGIGECPACAIAAVAAAGISGKS